MAHAKELILEIEQGAYDSAFRKLYGDNSAACEKQRKRYVEAVQHFVKLFPNDRDVQLYSTPGRTEIGGNHTDHNNGVVMAAAVNLDVIAVVAQNSDNIVRVKSAGFDRMDAVDMAQLSIDESEFGVSSALIRGVAAGIQQQGGNVGGFDAFTTSDVLRGSGLSSSAAFEVLMGAIFNGEFNERRFSAVEIAKISQFAENSYFGKPSGLMDQTACSVGSAITIDFKDPKNPIVNEVAFDLAKHDYMLCITDTKGSHAGLTDDYADVRSEMERVATFYGKKVLREVDEAQFYNDIAAVRLKTGDRAVLRAIHFFSDTKRAENLCKAVQEDRFHDFLQLIIEGGNSSLAYNQNAYSIKRSTEQGVVLGIALSQKLLAGKGAWRLQGGGFAGTIQAFVPNALLANYIAAMDHVFGEGACCVLNIRNYGAVQVTPNL